jgi:hypothetical protein
MRVACRLLHRIAEPKCGDTEVSPVRLGHSMKPAGGGCSGRPVPPDGVAVQRIAVYAPARHLDELDRLARRERISSRCSGR